MTRKPEDRRFMDGFSLTNNQDGEKKIVFRFFEDIPKQFLLKLCGD